MALTMVGTARAEWALNLPKGVTQISHEVYDLHMIVMWICVVIGIGVFGVMFYSIAKHRKSKGVVPAHFHESTAVEVAWTVIPFVILIAIAIPATKTLVNLYNSDDADMTIKVTGYQWKWHYEYLDGNVAFYSQLDSASNAARQLGSGIDPKTVENYLLNVDKPLVIPAGKKVRFLVTANDVIHAWWVPAIGWKIDAVPGFVNEMWTKVDQPGTYRGQCAELCGKDHGFMPVVVEVKPEAEYHTWLAAQQGEGANTRVAVAN
ncbi:MAG: cytochrome c oxidase subunit II [Chromatiales bacterium]|nr:cytochrome c oxidase subunit II [Chromatiales bacterium]